MRSGIVFWVAIVVLTLGCDESGSGGDSDDGDATALPPGIEVEPTEDCPLSPKAVDYEAFKTSVDELVQCLNPHAQLTVTCDRNQWVWHPFPLPIEGTNEGLVGTQLAKCSVSESGKVIVAYEATVDRLLTPTASVLSAESIYYDPECAIPFTDPGGLQAAELMIRRWIDCNDWETVWGDFDSMCWGPAEALWDTKLRIEGGWAYGQVGYSCQLYNSTARIVVGHTFRQRFLFDD